MKHFSELFIFNEIERKFVLSSALHTTLNDEILNRIFLPQMKELKMNDSFKIACNFIIKIRGCSAIVGFPVSEILKCILSMGNEMYPSF